MQPARPGVPFTRWEPRSAAPSVESFFDLDS
jgi:hypothetical protein